MSGWLYGGGGILAIASCVVCVVIARGKGYPSWPVFWFGVLGVVLPIIGIVVAVVAPRRGPYLDPPRR
jgi:hypothetical protein